MLIYIDVTCAIVKKSIHFDIIDNYPYSKILLLHFSAVIFGSKSLSYNSFSSLLFSKLLLWYLPVVVLNL